MRQKGVKKECGKADEEGIYANYESEETARINDN